MTGRGSALLGSAVLAALLVMAPAGAAHAADPLEVSLDGTTWSAALPAHLFPSPAVIVPGDVVAATLWVRNGSGDRARVDLEVADDLGVSPGTLAGDLSLTIDGAPTPGGASWHGPDLAPGEEALISLVVTFDASSQSMTQASIAAVLDSVTLMQTGVGPGAAPSTPTTSTDPTVQLTPAPAAGGSGLAHTGADVVQAAGAALSVVLLGFVLVVARRRSRRAEA